MLLSISCFVAPEQRMANGKPTRGRAGMAGRKRSANPVGNFRRSVICPVLRRRLGQPRSITRSPQRLGGKRPRRPSSRSSVAAVGVGHPAWR
ncbi:hypothetical protein NL676_033760 [Syzygium grande]|nr:hypothetical protein NL676_033760 [Syzygium grande]